MYIFLHILHLDYSTNNSMNNNPKYSNCSTPTVQSSSSYLKLHVTVETISAVNYCCNPLKYTFQFDTVVLVRVKIQF